MLDKSFEIHRRISLNGLLTITWKWIAAKAQNVEEAFGIDIDSALTFENYIIKICKKN